MEILLATASAFLFALGTVLQQKGAVREVAGSARGAAALLLHLARRPVWVGGIVADALGFAAQAAALAIGRLVVVQPILAAGVVFSLPLGARLTDQRIAPRDVLAAIAVTGALAVFLVAGDPAGGRDDAPFRDWLAAAVPIAAVSALLLAAGWRASPAVKATMLGLAAGVLFGLSAALTKATVDQLLDDGVLGVLLDWHLYALAAVGYAGMTLSEIALGTGVLAPAIASFSILDAVTSVALGLTLLEETIRHDALGIVLIVASLGVMSAGIVVLAGAEGARASPVPEPAG